MTIINHNSEVVTKFTYIYICQLLLEAKILSERITILVLKISRYEVCSLIHHCSDRRLKRIKMYWLMKLIYLTVRQKSSLKSSISYYSL